jgi:hypothetical protein
MYKPPNPLQIQSNKPKNQQTKPAVKQVFIKRKEDMEEEERVGELKQEGRRSRRR